MNLKSAVLVLLMLKPSSHSSDFYINSTIHTVTLRASHVCNTSKQNDIQQLKSELLGTLRDIWQILVFIRYKPVSSLLLNAKTFVFSFEESSWKNKQTLHNMVFDCQHI